MVRAGGFEPPLSWFQARWDARLPHTLLTGYQKVHSARVGFTFNWEPDALIVCTNYSSPTEGRSTGVLPITGGEDFFVGDIGLCTDLHGDDSNDRTCDLYSFHSHCHLSSTLCHSCPRFRGHGREPLRVTTTGTLLLPRSPHSLRCSSPHQGFTEVAFCGEWDPYSPHPPPCENPEPCTLCEPFDISSVTLMVHHTEVLFCKFSSTQHCSYYRVCGALPPPRSDHHSSLVVGPPHHHRYYHHTVSNWRQCGNGPTCARCGRLYGIPIDNGWNVSFKRHCVIGTTLALGLKVQP